MVEIKRFRYYRRLAKLGAGQDCRISLDDVANTLVTSKRHARNLLKEMQAFDWLEWQPSVGRNQRSRLYLKYQVDELQQQVARRLIEQGNYDQALEFLDNDHQGFGHLLRETSGASNRSGQLHLQLTYPRTFGPLLPHLPQRNSERFFLRQVYSNLVYCSEAGVVSPGLAHHWHHNESADIWTFYLRPNLSFHNGDKIDALCLVKLFEHLKALPRYQTELAHLGTIEARQPLCLEFTLTTPDLGFHGLLADTRYAIQPPEQVQQSLMRKVTGSGAFQVMEHNQHLQLSAFTDYYHCRALPDEVTIWNVPHEGRELMELTGLSDQKNTETDAGYTRCQYSLERQQAEPARSSSKQKQLEYGCIYLLFNQNTPEPLTLTQRRWLSTLLHPQQLLQLATPETSTGIEPAFNLLPFWSPVKKPASEKARLPDHLNIAIHDQYDVRKTALSVKQLLEQSGVQCSISIYPLATLQCQDKVTQLDENLFIVSHNLDDNRPSSAYRWFLSDPLLNSAISTGNQNWLKHQLQAMRQTTPLSHYLKELEHLATTMISECWLMPFYHQWQSLYFHDILQDVTMTEWGWPDIREVWMPE
ncbi:hypothetical protein GZ77_00220 [Endozoicomonas montiporae]|uniref:ABC transporter substrate-binding protein n=2 Tax=Endozoicomonas montiporae TaxID=1027273 RepID=A0A081N9P1_9GAMM|nr:SgrR family transcriptional regulator [Endozoicomonas montiporae]AMO55018.1 transporter [Endozoicomonas montiporae CL-33]KEQ15164.1 hypothetical protein GZ77_00220 [Endozoicomonas montiporae]